MTMRTYSIPCGKRLIPIQIPDHVPVQWVESRRLEPISDVKRAVEDALDHPIGSKRLRDLVRPGQTVALVVTDITRKLPEEIIVPLLLRNWKPEESRRRISPPSSPPAPIGPIPRRNSGKNTEPWWMRFPSSTMIPGSRRAWSDLAPLAVESHSSSIARWQRPTFGSPRE